MRLAYKLRPFNIIDAMRLHGSMAETAEVCAWLVSLGYPWLLGDATQPDTLKPLNGRPGDNGMYIDPTMGHLVIIDGNRRHEINYGDWVGYTDENRIIRVTDPIIVQYYEEV